MSEEQLKAILNDFYSYVMDEGTGMIREDDINTYLQYKYPENYMEE